MVELCASRIHILKHDEKTLLEEARDINVAKVMSFFLTLLMTPQIRSHESNVQVHLPCVLLK